MVQQRYYRTREIAPIFGLKPSYLEKLRSLRDGPKYIRLDGVVLYTLVDMQAWIDARSQVVEPLGFG